MKKVLALVLILVMVTMFFASCEDTNPPDNENSEKFPITFTVSPVGDDSTADGTEEKPFATLDKAVRSAFLTGADKYSHVDILIKEGEYTITSPITFEKVEDFATIRLFGEGNVILNGTSPKGIFDISANGVTLENLKINSSVGCGIVAEADNISVIGCEFSNIAGEYAIKIRGSNITVEGNYIHDCAGSAITVAAGDMETLEKSASVIHNNLIHDCGNGETNTPIINVCGVEITVSHNEIFNSPSSAIYWNGAYITIEYNEIHDLLTGLDDRGAIFTSGMAQVGNVIRYNYIHNIGGSEKVTIESGDHCAAIQAKDFASYYEVYGNIIETVNGNGMQIGGRNITVKGNLIIGCANWYVWIMTHQYSQFFRYGETDGVLDVPDYIYSPVWKEANPDLAFIVTDLTQTTFSDPHAWASPKGFVLENNYVYYDKFFRYFNNWGAAPYNIEDTVYTFSADTLDVVYGARENANMTVYNSKRDDVVIEELLELSKEIVDMDMERFEKIGLKEPKWNLD